MGKPSYARLSLTSRECGDFSPLFRRRLVAVNSTNSSARLDIAISIPFVTLPPIHMATIAILGTMDTKGEEHAFVANCIRQRGHQVLIIDTGILEEPKLKPDITRREIAAAAGIDLDSLTAKRDRGIAVQA